DGGGPRVRVVSGSVLSANPGQDAYSLPAMADFFALDPADRTGLRITARDLNGDGKAELIAVNGDRANPMARVITLADTPPPPGPRTRSPAPVPGPTIAGVYVG